MRNIRVLPWAAANWPALNVASTMRDNHDDRARKAGVREESLRATVGLREALPLSSWRGQSGRRYVVGIHLIAGLDLNAFALEAFTDAVVIAVRRGGDGTAHLIEVAPAGAGRRQLGPYWATRMRAQGATEFHIHRLAETEEERRAIAADLVGEMQLSA